MSYLKVALLASLAAIACCSRLIEATPYVTNIDGVRFDLTTSTYTVTNSPKDSFSINGTGYTVGPAWAIIRLEESGTFDYPEYALRGYNLGPETTPDNRYCEEGNLYHTKHYYEPSACSKWFWCDYTDCNWCCWVQLQKVSTYKAFTARIADVLMYSNFMGMKMTDKKFDYSNVGDYTISLGYKDQQFTWNGLITAWNAGNRELATLRYDTREKKLTTADAMYETYKPPTFKANEGDYDCKRDRLYCPINDEAYTETRKTYKVDLGFTYYTAMRPGIKKYDILDDPFLSVYGVQSVSDNNWVVDPCLGYFYVIQYSFPYWYIKTRNVLLLATNASCIIIQDTHDKDDLGVYTFSSDSKYIIPSKKFTGLLSRDLISTLTVKITTQWQAITDQSEIRLQPLFPGDHTLLLKSNAPTSCQIHLNFNYTVNVTFTRDYLSTRVDYSKNLPILPRATWVCGLASGWFDPPTEDSMLAARYIANISSPPSIFTIPVKPTTDPPGWWYQKINLILRSIANWWHEASDWVKMVIEYAMLAGLALLVCCCCSKCRKQSTEITIKSNELVPIKHHDSSDSDSESPKKEKKKPKTSLNDSSRQELNTSTGSTMKQPFNF